jgi:predicted nucleotidyltransferase component of viral defense system
MAERRRLGVSWDVLERDYALSWLLAGLARTSALCDFLVFKGGTALKKCYFGEDYRFSEDLDFSALAEAPQGEVLEAAVEEACTRAAELASPFAPVGFSSERYLERDPHPEAQDAFVVRVLLPWHRSPDYRTRVSIEITRVEKILRPVRTLPILHGYGERLTEKLQVYALEEIVAEKLRAILQHTAKLKARGWGRSRARDYYDLWRILGRFRDELELSDFSTLLHDKCSVRGVAFDDARTFFDTTTLTFVEKTWEKWLEPLVPQLPPFGLVIDELRPQVDALLA